MAARHALSSTFHHERTRVLDGTSFEHGQKPDLHQIRGGVEHLGMFTACDDLSQNTPTFKDLSHSEHRSQSLQFRVYLQGPLLNLPWIVLVVPNVRHGNILLVLVFPYGQPIPQKCKRVVLILIRNIKVLESRPLHELQVVKHTTWPDVDSAISSVFLGAISNVLSTG